MSSLFAYVQQKKCIEDTHFNKAPLTLSLPSSFFLRLIFTFELTTLSDDFSTTYLQMSIK